MRSLAYSKQSDAFIIQTDDKDEASRLWADGWGKTDMGGKAQGFALYSREPYAAVPYYDAADGSARKRLASLHDEYLRSYALTADYEPVLPATFPDWLEPVPFQKAGVAYALDRTHCLIADPMGLGKTAQAIMYANARGAERVLVVCPANARTQWAESVKVWSAIPRVGRNIHTIYKSADCTSEWAKYTIVSYDLLRNPGLYQAFLRQDWDVLILDEAHYLKTVDSQRSKHALGSLDGSVEGVASRAANVLGLTGTPLPNRPREAYNIARHFHWDCIDWASEETFQETFNPSTTLMTGHTMEYTHRKPELRARLRCNFMVRRRKRQAQPQLPEEWHEIVHVDPNGDIRQVLKEESLIDADLAQLKELNFSTGGENLAILRHKMGLAKAPRVAERVNMLMQGGLDKLFLVAYHKSVIKFLAEKLEDWGVVVLAGGQTPMQRDRAKKTFINYPGIRIAIGQMGAVGEALDGFQAVCARGMWAEPSWSSKDLEQVAGRLIRMGQKRHIIWEYLVAPGSLDEKILGRSIQKGQIVHEALDG